MSFRLGRHDGVSVVAETWQRTFEGWGWHTTTVAGDGPVDHLLPGLALGATSPPTDAELTDALSSADVVVVENLCTIPLNLPAARPPPPRHPGPAPPRPPPPPPRAPAAGAHPP
ncbi:MAG: hypothetical protein ACT4OV_12700, partial [Microthrixaceae bacterium]